MLQHHSPFWVNGSLNIKQKSRNWWATHIPTRSMKGGAMMDQMKDYLSLSSPCIPLSVPSPPPLIHLGCPLCEQGDKRGRLLAPIPHSAFPYRDKWLSLRPQAEGLALLTNSLGWFSICYVFSRKKMVSWITVFYCRMLMYASFLPTVILGGAHNEEFSRVEQINIARYYEDHEACKYCSQSGNQCCQFVSSLVFFFYLTVL